MPVQQIRETQVWQRRDRLTTFNAGHAPISPVLADYFKRYHLGVCLGFSRASFSADWSNAAAAMVLSKPALATAVGYRQYCHFGSHHGSGDRPPRFVSRS